jgi:ribonuclease D
LDLLYREDICKILHAGRQDMEVLADLRGVPPKNLFDTQIAASLLGIGEQVGYAALVQSEFQVSLDKQHTRTDWSKRPLDPGQLRYAADDVRYLFPLYERLKQSLQELQRYSWVVEECASLSDPELYQKSDESIWQRVKNWQSLQGQSLAYLQLLSLWREQRAKQANYPKRWILDDQSIIEFAAQQPTDANSAKKLFSDKFWNKNQRDILAIMQQASAVSAEQLPKPGFRGGLSAPQQSRLKAIQKAIKEKAAALNITPSILARRADLEKLVRGEDPGKLNSGWRQQALAEILSESP